MSHFSRSHHRPPSSYRSSFFRTGQYTRPRTRPRSTIRARLTLWYVLLLGLILIFFSGVLYTILDQALDGQVDANLRLAADQASGSLILEAGRLRVQQSEGESEITPLVEQGLLVRVLSRDGQALESLGPFHAMLLPTASFADALLGRSSFFQADAPPDGTPVRLYTTPYEENGQVYGVVVVGQSLQSNQDALHQLTLVLAGVVPLTLACASAGGLFLANRALQPIDHITRAAQLISAQDLSRRLDLDLPDDEVGRLARTFDTMLARLDEAFQRQRQFTTDASHELRTPLAIIKGSLGVALNRPRQAAEYQVVLSDLEEEVDRLTRLVEDLLLLARADCDQPFMHTESLDLADLLEAVVDQVRPMSEAKQITLNLQAPGALGLKGDSDKLVRLFLNLLDNAVKYTSDCGRIDVRAMSTNDQWVVVEVADTGPGVPAEQLERIFERFYRLDNARSRASGGAGLGLAIAQWIAQAHGGRIEVQSRSGQGSIFSVWLPTDS